ncbi:endolytic transglycosylase MltG [Leucobacter chromiireducens]|uniref:Endolytic murein transglycosylase n=1 Tax=Leucobacter chromiireducens subsp. chromiireducens TaxID=660067 RepID=A0ABS1SSR8_9MICO|nr:endolytic transglycosylase MltG [Leucobacter chromiireducens]MBL3690970.1 endolytic transglycosylase MltG [Leucobacter chromiireducens subsp. chromiireducens]
MNARARERERASGRGKRIAISLIVTVALLGGLAAAGAYLWSQFGERISETLGWTSNDYEGPGTGDAIIVITEGEIGENVAITLAEADVVKTSEAFYRLLLDQDPAVEFQPGSYRMKLQMSSQAALEALQDPENRMNFTAMIPEGKTVEQTIELVAAGADIPLSELQDAIKDPAAYGLPAGVDSLEGWLFPATYEFESDTTGAEAIQRLVDQQKQVLDEAGVAEADRERVLTIAAMVQKEGGRIEDFGKVSRVIANRLADDMLLQMDSTAQYGMGQHEDGSVWSTDEALSDDNPWNTYVHKGLPKGPIANPGRDAIDAALNPEPGDWIYFVAINLDTRESAFSVTQEEHEASVAKLNEWCAANPGKGC